jgi:hypothetical protein
MKNKDERLITCPNCKAQLDIDAILYETFAESIKQDLQSEIIRRESELNNQKENYLLLSEQLLEEREGIQEQIRQSVKSQVQSKEDALRNSIRQEVQEEKEKALRLLEEELTTKSEQLKEHNALKIQFSQLTRQFAEREAEIHMLAEQQLDSRLAQAKSAMKQQLEMESLVKVKEQQNIIESLKSKLQDATKRIEQGSMQMQGESFELAVEELVRDANPDDKVVEVKKGQKGFDTTQFVVTSQGHIASIGYEVKNTSGWSDSFIDKIKSDNLTAKCDLLVIVSKTLPKNSGDQRFILRQGVWITTINHVADLSILLRFSLIRLHAQKQHQHNGEHKANVLYTFLISDECQALFNSMMDGLKNLQDMNDEEERKLQVLFKKRQKQLQQILGNMLSYYGTMKSIADDSIQTIDSLEFKQAG